MKIKRIEAIHALEKKLGEFRALVPVYKARWLTHEHVLADQIINFDLQLIAVKSNQHATNSPAPHLHVPIHLHIIQPHLIRAHINHPLCGENNQTIWPECLLNPLEKYRMFIGTHVIPSGLQLVIFVRSNTCLFQMLCLVYIRRSLKQSLIVDGTSTNS